MSLLCNVVLVFCSSVGYALGVLVFCIALCLLMLCVYEWSLFICVAVCEVWCVWSGWVGGCVCVGVGVNGWSIDAGDSVAMVTIITVHVSPFLTYS